VAEIYHLVYRVAASLAERLAVVLPGGAEAGRARRAAADKWIGWARSEPRPGPVVWVHGASVGEARAAAPVVRRLLARRPDVIVVHSYTSSSVPGAAPAFSAQRRDYLPTDSARVAARVLDAVRPSLFLNVRGDLWPAYLAAAAARGIPTAIIGAQVRPTSWRPRWPARSLYATMLPAVSLVGATTEGDAARWRRMGVRSDAIQVTGDPRHDEVLERVPEPERIATLAAWASRGPLVVAGSTEADDEEAVLLATTRLLNELPDARVAIVPHHPDGSTVQRIVHRCGGLRLGIETWADVGTPSARLVIVAAQGVLFDLFSLASVAYVGGGFRRGRLHAVVEPAALGVPVIVGPRSRASADLNLLTESGGAYALPFRSAADALANRWITWCTDRRARDEAGQAARASIPRGASERTAVALLAMLESREGDAVSSQR
jgi:3-deoxy-D-manno-octulosonic-acid transferase